MNYKKTILYLLISVLVLILVYNFGLPFLASQYTTGMGMGMHMTYSYYNNSYYFYSNIISLLIVILIILIAIITIFKLFSFSGANKCRKCGMVIESDDWKICPRCGDPLDDGSVK